MAGAPWLSVNRYAGRRENVVIPAKAGIHACRGAAIAHVGTPQCIPERRLQRSWIPAFAHCCPGKVAASFSPEGSGASPLLRHSRAGGNQVVPHRNVRDGTGITTSSPLARRSSSSRRLGDRLGPRLRGDDEVVGEANQPSARAKNFLRTAVGFRRNDDLVGWRPTSQPTPSIHGLSSLSNPSPNTRASAFPCRRSTSASTRSAASSASPTSATATQPGSPGSSQVST